MYCSTLKKLNGYCMNTNERMNERMKGWYYIFNDRIEIVVSKLTMCLTLKNVE